LIGRCIDEFGRIGVMVGNAGIGEALPPQARLGDLQRRWRDRSTSTSSTFYCARVAAKAMVE
jgi:NAD(P)-dependent dehydrogenase (short-subunit alcohol dehydrogenase family)